MFLEPTMPMSVLAQAPLPSTGEVCVPQFVVLAVLAGYVPMAGAIAVMWKAGRARDDQYISHLEKKDSA